MNYMSFFVRSAQEGSDGFCDLKLSVVYQGEGNLRVIGEIQVSNDCYELLFYYRKREVGNFHKFVPSILSSLKMKIRQKK